MQNAKQKVALVQDTLTSRDWVWVPAFGLGTMDQLVPFHDSISVCHMVPPEFTR